MMQGRVMCRLMLLLAGTAMSGQVLAQSEADDIPRTSSGKPSFQGHWTSATVTPLERPQDLGEKQFFTEQEFEDYQTGRLVVRETQANTAGDVHYQLTDFGLDNSQNELATNMRTSIITYPADGRIPPTTPEAQALAAERRAYSQEHQFDSAADRPLAERCIMWGHNGAPMTPIIYNSNNQIVQTADHLVFIQEMMQEPRIIPMDGREALSSRIPQWYGSSRGHWDGETIVVETTNFTGLTNRNISPDGKVTERFTMLDADTMLYEFTVDDPATWTDTWSGEYRLTRTEGPMFEYACHEGNYGMANILRGIRVEEAAGER